MLKKVLKGIFYVIIMMGSVWASENFTEMIVSEFIDRCSPWKTYPSTILEFIVKEYDGVALYLLLEFALVFTAFIFAKRFLRLFRKETGES